MRKIYLFITLLFIATININAQILRAEELEEYAKEKYGEKRVSGIITFGTMAAKQVLRDVARVLNIPIYKVDSLSKFIPNFTKDKLEDIYQNNEAF